MLTIGEITTIILAGVFAPAILFFLFGMASTFVKSDISISPAVSNVFSIFLLASIGLSGGIEAVEAIRRHPDLVGIIVIVAIIAAILGVVFAITTSIILKNIVGFNTADAWAAGGHYAAVSSATLAVGVGIASAAQGAAPDASIFGGWMAVMYPFMDSPALITAILFGRISLAKEGTSTVRIDSKKILHNSIFGMAVWLLVSALIIGMLAQWFSPIETERTMRLFDDMFRGVLALFLIDMGISAGKQIGALKELGSKLGIAVLLAFIIPMIWGTIGILGIYGVHLVFPDTIGWGDAFVFATIAGGASFISAPAAMRASIPEANPSIYLPMSIALTFPFNIIVGMPIWRIMCMALWGV